MIVVLMGVSGSGKSTVGRLLAARLAWKFFEGDDYHPADNIEKMARGIPLTDEDRLPWLARIKSEMDSYSEQRANAVWACSALRVNYRDLLTGDRSDIRFVYLKGDPDLIRERLATRRDHYMKVSMLASQLASLEEPATAIVVDIRNSPQHIVSDIIRKLRRAMLSTISESSSDD